MENQERQPYVHNQNKILAAHTAGDLGTLKGTGRIASTSEINREGKKSKQ
jgi:hypothetical protein